MLWHPRYGHQSPNAKTQWYQDWSPSASGCLEKSYDKCAISFHANCTPLHRRSILFLRKHWCLIERRWDIRYTHTWIASFQTTKCRHNFKSRIFLGMIAYRYTVPVPGALRNCLEWVHFGAINNFEPDWLALTSMMPLLEAQLWYGVVRPREGCRGSQCWKTLKHWSRITM